MSEFLLFLFNVVIISLSGVMAPGAVTAAALAHGIKKPHSGIAIAIGHGIVEIPLIFLLILGLDVVLTNQVSKIIIGLTGGAFLIWMGIGMMREIKKPDYSAADSIAYSPVKTGIILSATNPYFLIWWATVGLNLAIGARQLGYLALVVFAFVHWFCDFLWLWCLTWTSFQGSKLLSRRNQIYIVGFCAAALIFFGGKFLYDATMAIFSGGNL